MTYQLLARMALGALLSGCTGWQARDVAPASDTPSPKPQRVRVTRTDGSQVVLEHAHITPTGVYGQWERTSAAIPATEIREVAVRGEDPSGTVALIAGIVGAVGMAGALALGAGEPTSDLR